MTTSAFRGRREDHRLLTGQGRYTNDMNLPGQLHAAFRRSDRAHARLRSIDKTAAETVPGVVAVLVGADLPADAFHTLPPLAPFRGRGGQPVLVPERPILASDRVRFVGEELALVIAETRAAAIDAAELIDVQLEDLPTVIGFEAALAADAPALHDNIPGNICFDFEYGDEARALETLARCEHVVRVSLDSPRVAPTPMELRGFLAAYDATTDRFDVWCAHQGGPALRDGLAVMLGMPPGKIRVHMSDVGGAFGARSVPFPEYPLLMFAAKSLGHPIKWLSTRTEDFLTDNHGRAVTLSGELGFDRSGRFQVLKTEWLCDSGAYLTQAGVLTNSLNGMTIGAGVYDVPVVYGRHRQVMTNTAPTNAYRGAGRPEANYIVERLVDEAAQALGLDPLALRERNAIRADQMPYRTATGTVFDSGDFPGLIETVRRASDWTGFATRQAEAARRGRRRGIGCAVFIEPSGGGVAAKDEAAIRFAPDGSVIVHTVAGPSGQGHETVFPDIVAAVLGIDAARIVLRAGDPSGPVLIGSPAIGSRSGMLQGSVCRLAAEIVVKKGYELAATVLEAAATDLEFEAGHYVIKGTDRRVALLSIIEQYASTDPHPLDTTAELPISRAFHNGAHVVEIEVDPDTGAVEIDRYTSVDDIGHIINHVLAEGQIMGGIVQSAGQVFGERCHYDPTDGQLLTASFMDYVMPRADLVGGLRLFSNARPTLVNPLGCEGGRRNRNHGSLAGLRQCCRSRAAFAGRRTVRHSRDPLPDLGGRQRCPAALRRRQISRRCALSPPP
jgi:aerobic carbon-monoxide dehydrogenase large subunit